MFSCKNGPSIPAGSQYLTEESKCIVCCMNRSPTESHACHILGRVVINFVGVPEMPNPPTDEASSSFAKAAMLCGVHIK